MERSKLVRFPWSRVGSLLVIIVLYPTLLLIHSSLFIMLCIFGCAVSLLILMGPPLKWYVKIWNEGGVIPEGHIEEKVATLASLMSKARKTIKMVTGEFNPEVYDALPVVEALNEAVERGVDVQITMGNQGKDTEELFVENLFRQNPNLVNLLGQYLRDGRIRIFYGPRPEKHFYIFDDDGVVEEEIHSAYNSLSWYWKRHTLFVAARDSTEFEAVKSNMRQVTFSEQYDREEEYDC